MVYKWYILPIRWLYGTYHLLREPETAIDVSALRFRRLSHRWANEIRAFCIFCRDFFGQKKRVETGRENEDYRWWFQTSCIYTRTLGLHDPNWRASFWKRSMACPKITHVQQSTRKSSLQVPPLQFITSFMIQVSQGSVIWDAIFCPSRMNVGWFIGDPLCRLQMLCYPGGDYYWEGFVPKLARSEKALAVWVIFEG